MESTTTISHESVAISDEKAGFEIYSFLNGTEPVRKQQVLLGLPVLDLI